MESEDFNTAAFRGSNVNSELLSSTDLRFGRFKRGYSIESPSECGKPIWVKSCMKFQTVFNKYLLHRNVSHLKNSRCFYWFWFQLQLTEKLVLYTCVIWYKCSTSTELSISVDRKYWKENGKYLKTYLIIATYWFCVVKTNNMWAQQFPALWEWK